MQIILTQKAEFPNLEQVPKIKQFKKLSLENKHWLDNRVYGEQALHCYAICKNAITVSNRYDWKEAL